MLELVVESWIWYSVATGIVVARFISRSLLLGSVKRLQADDWVMIFALATYTVLLVTINIVADTSSNLFPPGFDLSSLTPEEVTERQYGSKLVLVVEQAQCFTIWAVKTCLLILYYRLTVGLGENITVKVLAVYVGATFVTMEVLYFFVWCRPFQLYWAVPTPNAQCNTAINHLIMNAVFNISSDLAMLIMALQMLIRSHLPLRRKLILCGIFGLGVFVILSAVLNKYYSFTNPYGSLWTFWYVRESSTAMLVANLPFTWTLLRRIFNLKAFDGTTSLTGSSLGFHTSRSRSRGIGKDRRSSRRPSAHSPASSGRHTDDTDDSMSGPSFLGNRDSQYLPLKKSWAQRELLGRLDLDLLELDALDLWDTESGSPIQVQKKPLIEPGRRRSTDDIRSPDTVRSIDDMV